MFLTYLRYSTSRRYIKLIYYFDLFGAFYYIVTNIDRLDYKRDISTISFTVAIAKSKSLVFLYVFYENGVSYSDPGILF